MMDDFVREVHGLVINSVDAVRIVERNEEIALQVGSTERNLTPEKARYLAAKLYRLSRRIKVRRASLNRGEGG